MALSKRAVEEFRQLHEQKFGHRPNYEEAEKDLSKLMRIVSLTSVKSYEYETE